MRWTEKLVRRIAPPGTRRWRILMMTWRFLAHGEPFLISQLGMDHILYRLTPKFVRSMLRRSAGIGTIRYRKLRIVAAFRRFRGAPSIPLDQLLRDAGESMDQGNLGRAEALLEECLRDSPRCVDAYRLLAQVQAASGKYAAATRTLLTGLAAAPGSQDLRVQLASVHVCSAVFWEGEEVLTDLLKQNPDHAEASLLLADLCLMQAREGRAAELFRKVLMRDPENIAAREGLSACALAAVKTAPVSIIVPVWNQPEHTRRCLESLRGISPDVEVIVIDNNSGEPTSGYLDSQKGWIRVIRNDSNLGFVTACNQGAAAAGGEYLLFLNNDAVLTAAALSALIQTAESDPKIGAVGPKLLYPNGGLQEAGGIVFADGTAWNYGKWDDPKKPEYNYVRDTAYCSAACLLVRASAFREAGGFDEGYAPAYFEDTDLAFALRKQGYRVVYQPAAEVTHAEGATAGTDVESGFKKYQVVHAETFRRKWAGTLQHQPPFDPKDARNASNQGSAGRILIIDQFLPQHDRASGEHRLYQILKLLKEDGRDITFIARHGEYQVRYQHALQQMGVEVYATDRDRMIGWGYVPQALPIDFRDLLRRRRFSLAILSRYQIAQVYLPILRKHAPDLPVLVDSVDVHFLRERRKAALAGQADPRKNSDPIRFAEISVYNQSQGVIVVTDEDRAALLSERIGPPVFVIPNIHPEVADVPGFEERRDLLFAGNFLHPPNSDAMIHFCGSIFPQIRQRIPGIRLFVVGANSFILAGRLAQEGVVVMGYVPSLASFLRSCRVSVAPLRYGAGMKGKVGEAMSYGLPVVTTPVGVEGFHAEPGRHLLVEEEPSKFADAVVQLYTGEALWNRLSSGGRAHMEEHYSPAKVKPLLHACINSRISS